MLNMEELLMIKEKISSLIKCLIDCNPQKKALNISVIIWNNQKYPNI